MRLGIVAGVLLTLTVPVLIAAAPRGSAARGAGIARALGCTDCHGARLAGKVIVDDPTIATLWSSNLSQTLPRYSDAALERTLRTGIRPDGSKLWYMDAAPYAVMNDRDMQDLIAWLRTAKPSGVAHPRVQARARWHKAVAAGRLKPAADTLAAALAAPPPALGPALERGRYIARTQCAGCHEPDLKGLRDPQPGDPPDLAVAASYTLDGFRTLLRTGKAPGGREVGEMSKASRQRLAAMPESDIRVLHAYLAARTKGR
ncbi:Cytochrome c553 [Sphingomonas guangdongensis]|uniref:Cytochrome c553 n=1 Tax=Sphingomonas guangdongensis TaxID=1141890 RepID=A0A285R136_9SPHN|nr:c-type cytochrome [Sphingomonas guangdongensis]SOB87816.1 Cytochrome c553 [Sphingomonas guangdongensis]